MENFAYKEKLTSTKLNAMVGEINGKASSSELATLSQKVGELDDLQTTAKSDLEELKENQVTMEAIQDAMEALPDGSAVSAQVALNQTEIEKKPTISNSNDADLDIVDEEGNVLVRFKQGHIRTKYFNSSLIDNASNSTQKTILCIGDSLTQGQGEGKCYPTMLQAKVGSEWQVINKGEGGDKIQDLMARTNAYPAITKSAFTIPVSGSVSLGYLYSSYDNDRKINNLVPGASVYNPVTIQGIKGTLSVSGYYETAQYTFARESAGDAVQCKKGTPVFGYEGTLTDSGMLILWGGTNGLWTNEEELAYMQKSIIDKMGIEKYVVVGLTNKNYNYDTYTKCQFDYATLTKVMRKTFGVHYIDTLGYLLTDALTDANITATSNDTTAISNEMVPPSLLYDTVHFNAAGYSVITNLIYDKLKQLNYI